MWGVGGRSWGDAGVLVPDLGDGYTGVHSQHVDFPIHRKTSFFFSICVCYIPQLKQN